MAKVYFVREEISIEVPVGISVLEAEIRAGLAPDAPALLRDAAREVLDSRAEWKAAEQRRRAKETEREQESTPRGGFFSGLFGGRDDDKPRKNQPPEF